MPGHGKQVSWPDVWYINSWAILMKVHTFFKNQRKKKFLSLNKLESQLDPENWRVPAAFFVLPSVIKISFRLAIVLRESSFPRWRLASGIPSTLWASLTHPSRSAFSTFPSRAGYFIPSCYHAVDFSRLICIFLSPAHKTVIPGGQEPTLTHFLSPAPSTESMCVCGGGGGVSMDE